MRSNLRRPDGEERRKSAASRPMGCGCRVIIAVRVSAYECIMPRHIVCLTFDFDTQSGFIARGMTTPTPLSRGEFGAMASGRILTFLKERGIKATWFTPGFTIESWPKESDADVEGGHEIGHHSWVHAPKGNQTSDSDEA